MSPTRSPAAIESAVLPRPAQRRAAPRHRDQKDLFVAMGSSKRRTSSVRSTEVRSLNSLDEDEDGAPEPPTCSVAHCKALLVAIKTSWKDFCNATALHGMRYLFEEGRSVYERMFWVVALVICMVGCFQQILTAYNKWDLPPVLVSIAERSTPIWRVPFPAVTVCPEIKSRRSEFDYKATLNAFLLGQSHNSTESTNGSQPIFSERTMDALDAMSLVCDAYVNARSKQTLPPKVLEILRELAPSITETILDCAWQDQHQPIPNCTFPEGYPLFYPILTDEGLCFTFNILDITEMYTPAAVKFTWDTPREDLPDLPDYPASGWTPESGYPKTAARDTYPCRALEDGGEARLTIRLLTNLSDVDHDCSGPVRGFNVQVHSPAELPGMNKYFRVPDNKEVVVSVRPEVMVTSDELRNGYQPSRRQCFFSHERPLHFFQIYTQNNCEMECMANLTRDKCHCAAFFMPRASDIPLCGPEFMDCLDDAKRMMMKREIEVDLYGHSAIELQKDCHCLPACDSLLYEAKTTQLDYEWRTLDEEDQGEGISISRVSIFMEDTKFFASHRSSLYGKSDFLASCGGLLGLFCGFSLVSLVEIVYHLGIRLWCNTRRSRRRRERRRLRRQRQDPEAQEREQVEEESFTPTPASRRNGAARRGV